MSASQLTPQRAIAMGAIHAVPLASIGADNRLRPVDQAKVQLIADGILAWRATGNDGIPAPILVRPTARDGYALVAGAHRLAAVRLLGEDHIDAIVRDLDDLQARLIEIDENLIRNELNALDRAAFLAERDRIWRKMHPDKAGRKGSNKARWHSAGDPTEKFSFGSEIAEKVGLSDRAIRGDVKLYHMLALTPDVIDRVRGTWLEDNQSQLKALAKVGAGDRRAVIDLLFQEEKPARNVADALATMKGTRRDSPAPDEKAYALFVSLWTRAGAKLRSRILDHLDSVGALDAYLTGVED